ncbi:MAG: hypothetical protein IT260_08055 [Saprospiraceae bacterium]|nr:hypothetical protein [Saprospiraceae bacterium]
MTGWEQEQCPDMGDRAWIIQSYLKRTAKNKVFLQSAASLILILPKKRPNGQYQTDCRAKAQGKFDVRAGIRFPRFLVQIPPLALMPGDRYLQQPPKLRFVEP